MRRLRKIIVAITLFLGIACVVMGGILWYKIYQDYSKIHNTSVHFEGKSTQASSTIDQGSNVADLGTLLGGTVGLLFSLAGVFFFTYSLLQNQEEMSQNRDLISEQMAQSTFFNLLKHQKELYHSDDIYHNSVDQLRTYLRKFVNDASLKRFESFEATGFSPLNIYLTYDSLQVLADSMLNIANYINEQLADNEFYHRTFFLSLSENEKFLLGAVLENNLARGLDKGYRFDYRQNYIQNSPFRNPDESPFFPTITYTGLAFYFVLAMAEESIEEQRQDIENNTKFMLLPIPSVGLTFDKIHYFLKYRQDGIGQQDREEKGTIILENSFQGNFYPMIANNIWRLIRSGVRNIEISMNFVFTYKDEEFAIMQIKRKIGITKILNSMASAELREKYNAAAFFSVQMTSAT